MNWRERIVIDPAVLVGKAVIKGTRVSLELVMDQLARAYTMEQVLSQSPGITLQDLQARPSRSWHANRGWYAFSVASTPGRDPNDAS